MIEIWPMIWTLEPADPAQPDVERLLIAHARRARAETGRGSAHALDPEALRAADIVLFAARDQGEAVGIIALRALTPEAGEIKSMYTAVGGRRKGVGTALLEHVVQHARRIGMRTFYLETGSWPYFAAARAFYERHGFRACAPFGEYQEDPNSVFMMRRL